MLALIHSQLDYFRVNADIIFSIAPDHFWAEYFPSDAARTQEDREDQSPYASVPDENIRWNLDIQELAKNKKFVTALAIGLRNQIVFNKYRRAIVSDVEALYQVLRKAVDKSHSSFWKFESLR